MPRVTEWEWRHEIRRSELSGSAKFVAFTMALYMNPDGSNCRPGQRNLRADTGLAHDTINEALRTLEDEKWLQLDRAASGRRAAEYSATVPGDIWQEIALERPQEIMRHERAPETRSVPAQGTQTVVAFQHRVRNEGLSTDGPQDGPQDRVSVPAQGTQSPVARGLRAASVPAEATHLDLYLKPPPIEQPKDNKTVVAASNPRALGTNPRSTTRDTDLWTQAQTIAQDAGATNPVAYANSVYARLKHERESAKIAARAQTDIDNCPNCTSVGLKETPDGWIRCDHGE